MPDKKYSKRECVGVPMTADMVQKIDQSVAAECDRMQARVTRTCMIRAFILLGKEQWETLDDTQRNDWIARAR